MLGSTLHLETTLLDYIRNTIHEYLVDSCIVIGKQSSILKKVVTYFRSCEMWNIFTIYMSKRHRYKGQLITKSNN